MASKDLETLAIIPDLFNLSIDSLKIEGRMKSIHYIATVVKTYRQVIDDFAAGQLKSHTDYKAMMKAENRPSAPGFLNGVPDESGQINSDNSTGPTQNFIGIVREILPEKRQALIETRNAFTISDKLEVFSPDRPDTVLDLKTIQTEDGMPLTCSTRPLNRLLIETLTQVKPYDILRKVIE
jgi:putative protease